MPSQEGDIDYSQSSDKKVWSQFSLIQQAETKYLPRKKLKHFYFYLMPYISEAIFHPFMSDIVFAMLLFTQVSFFHHIQVQMHNLCFNKRLVSRSGGSYLPLKQVIPGLWYRTREKKERRMEIKSYLTAFISPTATAPSLAKTWVIL